MADTTITRSCYGIEYGSSQLYDCSTCPFKNECKNAEFMNPIHMDDLVHNRYWFSKDSISLSEGDTIRIKYKKVTKI